MSLAIFVTRFVLMPSKTLLQSMLMRNYGPCSTELVQVFSKVQVKLESTPLTRKGLD